MIRIYLAGHLHDDWRNQFIWEYETLLSLKGITNSNIEWLQPRRSFSESTGKPGSDAKKYVPNDIRLINSSDAVVFVLEKDHGNIGGAWEVGYAYAMHIPVLLLDRDPENYRYDILRMTSFVHTDESEMFEAIAMMEK